MYEVKLHVETFAKLYLKTKSDSMSELKYMRCEHSPTIYSLPTTKTLNLPSRISKSWEVITGCLKLFMTLYLNTTINITFE